MGATVGAHNNQGMMGHGRVDYGNNNNKRGSEFKKSAQHMLNR